jgi:hypothetical protein
MVILIARVELDDISIMMALLNLVTFQLIPQEVLLPMGELLIISLLKVEHLMT